MSYLLDDQDKKILAERVALREEIPGPRCGDYVRFPCGTELRIGIMDREGDWFQASKAWGDRSFYLYKGGGIDYSGGFFSLSRLSPLVLTNEVKDGSVWFPHRGYLTGGCQVVYATVPCRVFTTTESCPPY